MKYYTWAKKKFDFEKEATLIFLDKKEAQNSMHGFKTEWPYDDYEMYVYEITVKPIELYKGRKKFKKVFSKEKRK